MRRIDARFQKSQNASESHFKRNYTIIELNQMLNLKKQYKVPRKQLFWYPVKTQCIFLLIKQMKFEA